MDKKKMIEQMIFTAKATIESCERLKMKDEIMDKPLDPYWDKDIAENQALLLKLESKLALLKESEPTCNPLLEQQN